MLSVTVTATSARAQGWHGIVPLHSTRADVERLLGPPSEGARSYTVFYQTDTESVTIAYAPGLSCGIGAKYSQWKVPRNTVLTISVTLLRPLPFSKLAIDETKYTKTSGGHRPQDIYYIKNGGGESVRVFGGEVQDIDYYPAKSDYSLACSLTPTQDSGCEGLTPPHFDFYGNIRFTDEKARLDNFLVALTREKDRTGYIIAYAGKTARRGEASARALRARNYLVNVRHFPASRIKAIDGGYREQAEVDLYVVPNGICPPSPAPTVDPRDVKIGGQARR